MLGSAITPPRNAVLSARNVIVLAAAVFGLSIILTAVSAFRTEDSGGWGRDTFGTRGGGFRGLYEVLGELGVTVERQTAPPDEDMPIGDTLVLLESNDELVRVNPAYLQALDAWVKRGGRLIVAPDDPDRHSWRRRGSSQSWEEEVGPRNVLEALDLDGLVQLVPAEGGVSADDDDGSMFETRTTKSKTVLVHSIEPGHAFDDMATDVHELVIDEDGCATLKSKSKYLDGVLAYKDSKGKEKWLAAAVKDGEGEIIVVADPALFANRFLGEADNSVLAARLMAPSGGTVVFDEFYHGLSVRGNPFYLLTRPGIAAATAAVLLAIGAWAWRTAVFLGPPLPDVEASRRNIGEYLNAMGNFFSRGRGSGAFLLVETRDGVLRELCRKLHLPVETPEPAAVISALGRRNANAARELSAALAEADAALAEADDRAGASCYLSIMQRLNNCLSSNTIGSSAKSYSR
jgi:hypothetical protein